MHMIDDAHNLMLHTLQLFLIGKFAISHMSIESFHIRNTQCCYLKAGLINTPTAWGNLLKSLGHLTLLLDEVCPTAAIEPSVSSALGIYRQP